MLPCLSRRARRILVPAVALDVIGIVLLYVHIYDLAAMALCFSVAWLLWHWRESMS